jgi:alpha-amylase
MILTCRKHGVRVYADAVINHMSGGGNDAHHYHRNGNGGHCDKWGAKNGTAGKLI